MSFPAPRSLSRIRLAPLAGLLVACSFQASAAPAQESGSEKPASEMSIKEIMDAAHKKPDGASASLLKLVAKGEATEAQQQQLLELYESMAKQDPPTGDKKSWKELNDLLIDATKAVVAGDEGADRKLKKASNCIKCHKAHKPAS